MPEKSFERKAELLEAALDEFIANNYEEASLNTIIKNAGISKGTFYYHFKDKQALYLFLLESSVETKWQFIREKAQTQPTGYEEKDIFEKFKLQARMGAEFAAAFPKYHRLSKMFAKERGHEIYEVAKDLLANGTEGLLEEMIHKAIEAGDFKKEFSKDFITKTVGHLFVHFDEIFHTQEDLELEQMLMNLDSLANFMKNGLGRERSA